MELQKEAEEEGVEQPPFFGPGLQGARKSLKPDVASGVPTGEIAPGLGFTSANGGTLARGIWAGTDKS